MGISNLVSLFAENKKEVTLKDLENLTIAIDVSNEVYRSILAMKSVKALADADGNVTSHINTFLSNILAYQKHNIKPIYIFDNCMYKEKQNTLINRRAKKEVAETKITEIAEKKKIVLTDEHGNVMEPVNDDSEVVNLEKQAFTPTRQHYNDIKTMLEYFGIPYVYGPDDLCYEAEQYAAFLTQINKADVVLSSDADAFMFGAKKILRKEMVTNKNGRSVGKLFLYDMTVDQKFTRDQIINIGISLGTDFCHGTPRIGIKTAVKKLDTLATLFDDEQKRAKEIFNIEMAEIEPVVKESNIPALNEWLKSKGFKKQVPVV
jgi:flap endonuclease-1